MVISLKLTWICETSFACAQVQLLCHHYLGLFWDKGLLSNILSKNHLHQQRAMGGGCNSAVI